MPGPFRRESTKVDDDMISPNRLANMRRPQLRQSGSSSNLNFVPLRPSPLTSRPYSGMFDGDDVIAHVPVPLDPQRGLAAPRMASHARTRSPRIAQLDFEEATRLARSVTPPSSASTMGGFGPVSQEKETKPPTRNNSFTTSVESSSSEASPPPPGSIPLPSIRAAFPPTHEHDQFVAFRGNGLEPNRRQRTMSNWEASSSPPIFPRKKEPDDEYKFPPSKALSRPTSFGDLKKQASGFLSKSSSQSSLSLSTVPRSDEQAVIEKGYGKDDKGGRGKRLSQSTSCRIVFHYDDELTSSLLG